MSDSSVPPVLLVIFNRPDLTARVFDRLREVRPQRLFIAADGPREGKEGEEELCRLTREATYEVDWPCEVRRLEGDCNQGCKISLWRAISWFFEQVEEGIILEDDCLPDPTFFRFCGELLERYRTEAGIALISGNDFQKRPARDSYYFSRYPQIWGWASWRRTWERFDLELKDWTGDPDSLRSFVKNGRVRRHFARRFDSVKWGGKDSWAFQMVYLCLTKGLLCVNPSGNLVENVGFDERATHTWPQDSEYPVPPAVPMSFPLRHPEVVEVDERADRYTETHVRDIPPNLWALWMRSLRKRMKRRGA